MAKSDFDYKYNDQILVLNNDDNDLFPIKVDLLDVIRRTYREYGLAEPKKFPEFKLIDGYGKNPEDQVFERQETPPKLVALEERLRKHLKRERKISNIKKELLLIDMFWEELDEKQSEYKKELAWLRKMVYHRIFGYWFFCNGIATYITGDHFFFLNWWYLDDILPEYRDRDRRVYIGEMFAELDTTTFKNIDPVTRKPIPNENGEYEMIDLGYRVCLGANRPKARRVGDTSKIQAKGANRVTLHGDFHFGSQGRDESHALKIFRENFVNPFIKLPVFFKPQWDSQLGVRPKEHFLFDSEDGGLPYHTRVTHALTASAENYNGDKLHLYHRDEAGNTAGENVNDGHKIIKHCLMLGSKIIGFADYTTTVQSVSERSAGENYFKLCMDSQYEIRNENGQTSSGMYNLFTRGEDGKEGNVGKYGESIIGTPTPEQARFIGRSYGAKQEIENEVKEYKRKKDWEGLAIYQRQYPQCFRDCFSPPARSQFFNQELLRTRVQYLNFSAREELPRRGDFVRKSFPDGEVIFIDNPDGRFYLSIDMEGMMGKYGKNYKPSQRYQEDGNWLPVNPIIFVASTDTFGQDKTLGRASNGGGAVRWLRDKSVDPDTKDISQWLSQRPVCTYNFRPDTVEEYSEDMLMMCEYFNAMCYPERNKTNTIDYFRAKKREGYLLYDFDPLTLKRASIPGWWHGGQSNDKALKVFNLFRDDISKNGKRWTHTDLITECLSIVDPKDMTNYDLFTAYGGCLLAEMNPFYTMMEQALDNQIDTKEWMNMYT